MYGKWIGCLLFVLLMALPLPARGEILVNEFDVNLYGRWWHVQSYFVQDDVLTHPLDTPFLEPEGLAYSNSILYVSGDRGQYEAASRLAQYACLPDGTITFSSFLQMNVAGDPDGWGPEGLAFNTSGGGYGGGVNELVSVELDGSGRVGTIDLLTGDVIAISAITEAEGVAYAPVAAEFATLEDAGGPVTAAFYDQTFMPTGGTMTVAPASNGVAAISAAFASFLTGETVAAECLLTVSKANPGNAVNVYDLPGSAIGNQQDLPVLPEARVPIGGGFYIMKPAFGTVEAVAVNEVGEMIYFGDEDNSMVHSLTPGLLVGDIDGDGDKDADDVTAFVDALLGEPVPPEYEERSDINADTFVNGLDVQPFVFAFLGL